MDEGHQCQEERESSRCLVLLPRVVCLQEGATWLCVSVAKGQGLDGEIGIPRSLMTIECVSQDDSLMRAPGWHSAQPSATSSHCRKPAGMLYECARMFGSQQKP